MCKRTLAAFALFVCLAIPTLAGDIGSGPGYVPPPPPPNPVVQADDFETMLIMALLDFLV